MAVLRQTRCSECGHDWQTHPDVRIPNGWATACPGARAVTEEYVPADQLAGAVEAIRDALLNLDNPSIKADPAGNDVLREYAVNRLRAALGEQS